MTRERTGTLWSSANQKLTPVPEVRGVIETWPLLGAVQTEEATIKMVKNFLKVMRTLL
jgi:hypothetical protein